MLIFQVLILKNTQFDQRRKGNLQCSHPQRVTMHIKDVKYQWSSRECLVFLSLYTSRQMTQMVIPMKTEIIIIFNKIKREIF